MLQKTEAVVLRHVKYGESKLIVDMFTRQHGRLSFLVTVSSSPRSRFRKQYFQPLTWLTIDVDVRPQSRMQRLHDVALNQPLASLSSHPSKIAISLFVAEFLGCALRDEQGNEKLFDYMRFSMEWLNGCTHDFANFHLVFLMHLSRFLGFYPNLEDYRPGHCFDLRVAAFTDSEPLHPDYLPAGDSEHVFTLMRMNYNTMHLFKMNHGDRRRILNILMRFYQIHLPGFTDLRSLHVLTQLFDE